ncbi:MAG: primosomal protein N' [Nitrospiraceae bacterium]|nr:primosomal protein N' [Nitrospiraceae bacterium]
MPPAIADIAVPVNLFRTFHYRIPAHLDTHLVPGSRVLVPFGSRRVTGTVVGFPGAAERDLKEIIDLAGEAVSPDLLRLAVWMAEYYLHPLGLSIETLLPKGVEEVPRRRRKLLRLLDGDHDLSRLRGPKQEALLHLLLDRQVVPYDDLGDFASSTIKAVVGAGFAVSVEEEIVEQPIGISPASDAPPSLMPEQARAVQAITESIAGGRFETFLLHGVTGSGKTEVYLHAIASLAGRGAIVLVPEIALTPQLVDRFRKRFGDRIAVLHSGLTDRERADEYRRIRDGRVQVAIGARSAVFAPFPSLGLVIVDEEHENSYKQDEGLHYHARDVAVMRAKFSAAVCVLGSATPSLESFFNARAGKYRILSIANRVDHRPLPEVKVVDRRAEQSKADCSSLLVGAMQERVARREQALLLLNRRGFSTVLICGDCGKVLQCPGCSVSLTFHKREGLLKCHYCDFHMPPPEKCPACGGLSLKPLGSGTQRIEEEVAACAPSARISRMDSDSVRGRKAYEELLGRVDRGETDILLGTQMIAKGHDFPSVTLVGVVDADVGLNLPDFRSAEKTFQLITQAAGRAGRGDAAGEVIIQTSNPGHYALVHSRTHDYAGFYDEEIEYRMELGYPPVRRMIKIEVKSGQERLARESASRAADRIRRLLKGKETTLLGPAPSPIAKVRGKYRYQLLLLSPKREVLRMLAVEARSVVEQAYGRKVQVSVDVDPVNLM